MEEFVSVLLASLAALLAIPVGVFFLEVIAAVALKVRDRAVSPAMPRPRVAILVPAHNESTGLLPTIADIKAQMRPTDRLLVVADNCTDDTAAVAAGAGAEVIARNDREKIGKGYALEWGLRHLSADPPDTVIVFDADCRLADLAIERLSMSSAVTARPAQALYLMNAPDLSAINHQLAEFAWRVKNWVRPLGLAALGRPCQLMGTGMAFPWGAISLAKLASGQIVEDLSLGLDLAVAGRAPLFCPAARVTSQFPVSARAADLQRQRWEQGHIDMIATRALRLIGLAIKRRDLDLLALALDLTVPPLVLLGLLTVGMLVLAGLATWLIGSHAAFVIAAASFSALVVACLLSWVTFARDISPLRAIAAIVPYMLQKLRLYWRLLSGARMSQWIRTDRK
jgi:cellulose synthase/poly-beta-1,6-N-acetylglucosamine synthase-like glycosyltransferase